jgi:hypothetical protein
VGLALALLAPGPPSEGGTMDREQTTYRGTEVPVPIRWGMDDPPRPSLYQRVVIVGAAVVGFALMVASILVRL